MLIAGGFALFGDTDIETILRDYICGSGELLFSGVDLRLGYVWISASPICWHCVLFLFGQWCRPIGYLERIAWSAVGNLEPNHSVRIRGEKSLKREGGESRTIAQLREHYEIEKELADKLRHASKEERARLYASCYDELFVRVPHHPQNARKADIQTRRTAIGVQLDLLAQFIRSDSIFMEIGAGDCSLSMELAKRVAKVFAVDVSKEITDGGNRPANFKLLLSDGSSIPLPRNTVNVAYSYQLMEHLHPDDAKSFFLEHVNNIAGSAFAHRVGFNDGEGPLQSFHFDF